MAEADENYAESRRQLEQALSIRNEADAYKEKAVGSAEKQAQELLRAATHAVEVECARLKKQASLEAYQLLAQAEAMRGVAQEELEAQNIYASLLISDNTVREFMGDVRMKAAGTVVAISLCFDIFIASSTSGLYSTVLPGSKPQEAVIKTLALLSSILLANSFEAKPPKTTEWIAPILPQASIAITASGIIGM